MSTRAIPNDGELPSHLSFIHVDRVWNELGVKGKGIVVAGQDTGVYWEHNALKRQYRGNQGTTVDHNYNWHSAVHEASSCAANSPFPCDDYGHGTHTIGTIVGSDGGTHQIGVAPEAQWIACSNIRNNVGTVASYLECFEFMLAPYPLGGDPRKDGKPELAPHIVNNSWGCTSGEGCKGAEFIDSVRAMKAAGIFVVAASGNDGPNCGSVNEAPAIMPGIFFSVGAFNRYQNEIAFFSSRGRRAGTADWLRISSPPVRISGQPSRQAPMTIKTWAELRWRPRTSRARSP